jgi:hypothetical protein
MTYCSRGLLMLSLIGTCACTTQPQFKTVEGRVYARLDNVRGPVDPVAGATVSNNWDKTTATTDSTGRFLIRVKRVAPDEFVIFRVDVNGKAACERVAGGPPDGYTVKIFLDGGWMLHQRC